MAKLNAREQRIVKWALVLVPLYLLLFYGLAGVRALEEQRKEFGNIQLEAEEVELRITKEAKKYKRLKRMREEWSLHLKELNTATLVTSAREAVQSAASKCGVGLGNSQEMGRGNNNDLLRVIQMQGSGKTEAVLRFLYLCPRLGYPLLLDNLQIKGVPGKPGRLTLTFSLAIVNTDRWKEKSDA